MRRGALLVVLGVLIASVLLAVSAQRRVAKLEQELVRRQQDSQTQSGEARMLAKQAQESAHESAAKVALLDARLSEVSVQRSQLEALIQTLSRSRDENIVVDIEATLRIAQQQALATGSAEPLVAALKQADERLARHSQPRLETVRRAIARDIDRVKSVGMPDISALSAKLDEAARLVDDLPLLSQPSMRAEPPAKPGHAQRTSPRGVQAPNAAASAPADPSWSQSASAWWNDILERIWAETRGLVRVTQIDHPDAMLIAPEQAFFLRENLKLRLLNARLGLLSRQFDTVQSDLQGVQVSLERYFDRGSRRTTVLAELVKQVQAAARNVPMPRPDDTLAALTAAAAGR